MKLIILVLLLILIALIIAIFYFTAYGKLSEIKTKMDNANENITNLLKEKYELMKKLYEIIKKNVKKKDYLKDFSKLAKHNLTNYELDNELNTYLKTMTELKDDYKVLNNKENNELFKKIKMIDQDITANKKFFNKNNNQLIKSLTGYNKIVGKMLNINVKTSYEIKKPNAD
ncbi:MAG: hypothetical protein IKR74_03395 [Bacilli bacterium]|nr:hypothetical protein [Bacilli bacterium]